MCVRVYNTHRVAVFITQNSSWRWRGEWVFSGFRMKGLSACSQPDSREACIKFICGWVLFLHLIFFLEDILGFIFSNFQLRSKCNSHYFLFTFHFSRDGSSHACLFCCCEDWFEAIGDRPGWAKRGEAWISNKDFAWIIDDRLIVRMLPTKTGRIICLHSLTLIIFHKMIQNREKNVTEGRSIYQLVLAWDQCHFLSL